jgi:diguanylate cyclase (GGDEF)-like protein/PAS domain S-box-containing protein
VTGVLLAFVVVTVLAALSSATLALLSWQRRRVPGALFFSALMVGATVWCGAYVGELTSSSLQTKTIWAKLAYLGIATVPPSWLLFCLSYTGKLRRRTTGAMLAFYLLPLATVIFAMLSTDVPLLWSQTSIVSSDGIRVLVVGHGPWFWVHTAYCYACLAGGSVVLLVSISRQVRPLTKQGLAFVAAVSLPWLMNALTIFHLIPLGYLDPLGVLDLTPPALVASAALVAIGLWRLEMFDVFPGLVPMARDAVIMELQDGVLVVDGHGRVLSANRAAEELLSRSGQPLVGQPLAALVDEANSAHEALSNLWAVSRQRLEMIVPAGDGQQRHVEIAISSQGSSRHGDGHVLVMRDITERVAIAQALRESGQRLRVLFDQSPVGVMVFDRDLLVTECNDRFATMVQMTHDHLIGHDLASAEDSSLLPLYQAALEGVVSPYSGPYTLSSSGDQVWLQGEVSPLRDDAGETAGGISVLWDITDSKRAEELIERLAFNDTVTGLPNRTLFRDRLRQALAQAARSASSPIVALVNLDRFKAANEAIGHAAADRLLQAIGERLQANARSEDTIARWGGDEFAVLIPGLATGNDGFVVAKRLAECFAKPWLIDGHELWLTASTGLATYPDDGGDAQALLDNAETAMHGAKKLGGDCQQVLRSDHERPRRGPPGTHERTAPGPRRARVRRLLPAPGRSRHDVRHRLRGAAALESPPARAGAARPLHPARRRDRTDAAHR